MAEIGIRALKQNASAVVERAALGESLTVTDRGRPVARLVPLQHSALGRLVETGAARPPRRTLADLPKPVPSTAGSVTDALRADRTAERY